VDRSIDKILGFGGAARRDHQGRQLAPELKRLGAGSPDHCRKLLLKIGNGHNRAGINRGLHSGADCLRYEFLPPRLRLGDPAHLTEDLIPLALPEPT